VPVSLGRAIGNHVKKLLANEAIEKYENFNYSRYKNTNDLEFRELVRKRERRKADIQPSLDF
jgi:DNA (cytosine-5)-methyltransferase 1